MEASKSHPKRPPRIEAGSRLPHLLLLGACTGIFLGGVLRQLGLGHRRSLRLVRAPAEAPTIPANPPLVPVAPPPPEWKLALVTSAPGDSRTPRARLILELEQPAKLAIDLRRTGRPGKNLYRAIDPSRRFQARIPSLPAGEVAELVVTNLSGAGEHRWPLVGRGLSQRPVTPAAPGLLGIQAVPDGVVVLGPGDALRRFEGEALATSARSPSPLTGNAVHQRGHLVVLGPRGRLQAFASADLLHVWRHHPVAPGTTPPTRIPPNQLLLTTPKTPLGLPALTCLEVTRGVPMWRAPLVLPAPLAPGGFGTSGSRFVVAPLERARIQVYNTYGEGPRLDLPGVMTQEFSAPPALSPSNRWVALGDMGGGIRTLSLHDRIRRPRPPEADQPALFSGEIAQRLGLSPIRHVHFLDEEELLARSDEEAMLVQVDGTTRWRAHLSSPADFGPAFVGEQVFLGLREGTLLVLRRQDGEVLERLDVGRLLPGSLEPGVEPLYWASETQGVMRIASPGHPFLASARSGPLATAATDPLAH